MADVTFRTSTPSTPAPESPRQTAPSDPKSTVPDTDVPVPYLDYKTTHHKPYTVEYFELGNMWDDKDGGFESEINIIEDYMFHLIGHEKLGNSTEAVNEKMKSIERQAGIKKFETTTTRIAKIAAFTKFLNETEDL